MSDLLLDEVTGDLAIVGQDLLLTRTTKEEVRQRLLSRLSTYLGEWALDITYGFPWREEVLVKSPNLLAIKGLLLQAIARCPGVVRVEDLTLSLTHGHLAINFRAIVRDPLESETLLALDFAGGSALDNTSNLWLLLSPQGGYR